MDNNRILNKIRKLLAKAKDPASSENEIEIFMKAAQKLMMAYNLQESDIEIHPSDINKEVIFSKLWKVYRYKSANYEWELLEVISDFHNCKILRGLEYDFSDPNWNDTKSIRLSIVGTLENRMLVKELYESSVEKFLKLSGIRYKEYQIKRKSEIFKDLQSMGLDTKGLSVQYLEGVKQMVSKPTYITSYLIGTIEGLRKYLDDQKREILYLESDQNKWGLIVKKHNELIDLRLPELFPQPIKSKKIGEGVVNSPEGYSEGIKDGSINPNTKMIE